MKPKTVVKIAALVPLAFTVLAFLLDVHDSGMNNLHRSLPWLTLMIVLTALLIRGWPPARWFAVTVDGLYAAMGIVLAVRLMSSGLPHHVQIGCIRLVVPLLYAGCVALLLTARAKSHFKWR